MPQLEVETPVPLFARPVPTRLDAPTARRRDRHRLGQAPDREGWRARSGVPDHGAEVRKTEARARGQLMSADIYSAQVALLVRIIPEIAREDIFALKGGTAINLFVRDLPRLSVDIDLVYLPIAPRAASLSALHDAFPRLRTQERRIGK